MVKGPVHMTLIDPDKQNPAEAAEIAYVAQEYGSSAVMVGGSTGVTRENTEKTVMEIRKGCSLPLIAFPSSAEGLSPLFDAVYFLSMMNSRDPRRITGEQAYAALLVKRMGIEPIGMGYIIVEPGMKVGQVGSADPVGREDVQRAMGYALAGEFFGMKLIYLEAGSGSPLPVPTEMIRGVREVISVPLVVGGGIREPEQASEAARAGASIIVTGTVIEENGVARLKRILGALREMGTSE